MNQERIDYINNNPEKFYYLIKRFYSWSIPNEICLGKVTIKPSISDDNDNDNDECIIHYCPGFGKVWLSDMKKEYNKLVDTYGEKNITIIKPSFGVYYPYP